MPNNKLHISTICVVFSHETGSASMNRIFPVKGGRLKWMGFAGKTSLFLEPLHSYIYKSTWISLSFAFSKSTLPRLPRKAWHNMLPRMKRDQLWQVKDTRETGGSRCGWLTLQGFHKLQGKNVTFAAHSQFRYLSEDISNPVTCEILT